jgi:hypothetical protein
MIATILAEYRRALAAAREYEDLRLHRESAVRGRDIPRRIFDEFYSRIDDGFERPFSGPRRGGHDARIQDRPPQAFGVACGSPS